MIEGFGVGCTFQPSIFSSIAIADASQSALVAAQATAPKPDRAVVTSIPLLRFALITHGLRNFFRNIGGAFGLTGTLIYLIIC